MVGGGDPAASHWEQGWDHGPLKRGPSWTAGSAVSRRNTRRIETHIRSSSFVERPCVRQGFWPVHPLRVAPMCSSPPASERSCLTPSVPNPDSPQTGVERGSRQTLGVPGTLKVLLPPDPVVVPPPAENHLAFLLNDELTNSPQPQPTAPHPSQHLPQREPPSRLPAPPPTS